MPDIELDHAQRIIAKGRAAALEAGLRAVFVVLDKGAHLVAFSRMDGAWLGSNDLAIAKARSSAMFQAPSEALNAPLKVGDVAEQDLLGQRVLQFLLDHALQRPRAIGRIVALVGQPVDRVLGSRSSAILRSSSSFSSRFSWISTIGPCPAAQPVEQDDLVDAVEELRPEVRPHHAHHLVAHRVDILAFRQVDQIFGAEVRGHDDQRVAEVDRAALPVGQAAVVEHLQAAR
jgi:hypothetical protein